MSALVLCACASTSGFDGMDAYGAPDAGALTGSAGFDNPEINPESVIERFGFVESPSLGDPFAPSGTASCDAGNVIYVFDTAGVLTAFDPISLIFSTIGTVQCPGEAGLPNSLTVDRQGSAWVSYHGGAIYKVSTVDALCTTTSYVPPQDGWKAFGIAFVRDPSSDEDTLYLSDGTSLVETGYHNRGLARIDQASLTLSVIGEYGPPIAGSACELTGLADGSLHALCPGTPTQFVQIQPTDAGIVAHEPLPLGHVSAWAYAHWGGGYYIFSTPRHGVPSRLDRFVPNLGTKRLLEDTGMRIVGAGVSTCAPLSVD